MDLWWLDDILLAFSLILWYNIVSTRVATEKQTVHLPVLTVLIDSYEGQIR